MTRFFTFFSMLIFVAVAMAQSSPNVVAKLGEEEITISDLENFQPGMPFQKNMPFDQTGSTNRKLADNEKEGRLEEVIQSKLLLKDAKASGIEKDPDFLAKKKSIEEQVLLGLYLEKVVKASIKPSDEELRSNYEQNTRFNRPPTAKLIRIISSDESSAKADLAILRGMKADEITDQRFRVEELTIYEEQKLKEAASMGGNRTPDANGKGLDPHMQMMKAIAEGKAGDVIGPFGQGGQFMSAKILEKNPAGKMPFEQVKEDIRREIVDREFHRVLDEKKRELRKKAIITIYYENLDKAMK